tara:strand:+ start:804 stop:1112 length:309 start_codon:yes stop_codon:yes gene_type:complete
MIEIPELPFEIISKILKLRMESKKSDRIDRELLEETELNKFKYSIVMHQLDYLIEDLGFSLQVQIDNEPEFEEELNNLIFSELLIEQIEFYNHCIIDDTEDY